MKIWDITKREECLEKSNKTIDNMSDDELVELVYKVLSEVK